MLAYLDAWYAALARLEEADFSALFSDPLQARFNESALALQVGLRTMTPGVDYSLIGYSYTLTVLEAGQEEDGTVSVLAQEASTQNFAQFPGVDARRGSNYHTSSPCPPTGRAGCWRPIYPSTPWPPSCWTPSLSRSWPRPT